MFAGKVFCTIAFVLFVKAQSAFGKPAEQYFHLCHRGDSDFEECIKKSLMEAKPYLMKGIEEIELPPFDPYALSAIDFKENNANFKFALSFSKIQATGFSDLTVENVKFEENEDSTMTLNVTVKTPHLRLYGKYFINGRVLLIRLEGKGDMDLNFTEPIFKISIKGTPVTNVKDDEKYLQVDAVNVDMTMKGGHAHLDNLFNGDKTLGRVANNFINDNFLIIFRGLKHLPEQWFARNFDRSAETIFNAWPITQLLPQ